MTSGMLFSQAAADRLYLTTVSTGRVYDITALSATPTTAIALPPPVTTPGVPGGTTANASNLAVGYDVPGGSPSSLVFLQSNNVAGATIYKNGTAVTGTVMPSVAIGGIATNNVPGTYFGNVYGFQSNTKTLYPIYPSGTAIPITSTDTDWNNGTTFGTDTFFDYQNNIYTFINNGSNRYLFKISIATGVAEKAISAPISGSASFANLPTASGIQGMAYLQGYVYIATTTATPTIEIRRISMNTGASTLVATYTSSSNANLDLATVPYYVPFQFTCGGITQSPTTPFVEGVASNGERVLNIPITNVYGPGTYTINITGENFNSSSTVNITSSTTSINVPLVYDGGGSSGTRTLSVNLNGSSTACSVNVVVEKDTDKDTIPDYQDLDDDNDGITDCDENLLGANASVSNVFSFVTAGTAVATSNNEVRLTQNTGNQAGQIWSVGKVDFTKSFVLRFDAYLGTNDNGADGIAAVFHNSPQGVNATGAAGLGIGARGIANGIVLELDTYDNGTSLGDISSDHGQIWDSDNQTSTGFLTTAVALPNLENSAWHPVVINWNATTKTISYTVDGTNAGTYTGDLVTNYFAGANKVYFGYTASTGASTNEQKIRINSFCSDLPLELDKDGDGIPNSLDLDSDGDGCPDAIEGSENVKYNQIHDLNLPLADPNYAYRGQIKVTYNGTTTSTPSGIISNSPSANGVPQLLNDAGNNLNASTNPSNLAGAVDNTDGTADIGQGIGDSQDNTINSCKCYKAPSTDSNTYPTQHGITAFNRAGTDNQNWPMVRQSGWTALEASTKGFVINRMPVSTSGANTGEPVDESNNAVITSPIAGMMFYDTTNDCLKINVDGTRSGWKCFNKQTCPDEN